MTAVAATKPSNVSAKEKAFLARKVTTPEFRASYPHVFKQRKFSEDQEAKYEITMLFDKAKADMKPMRQACGNAMTQKFGPDRAKWPKDVTYPFKDGDTMQDKPECKGMIQVKATSKFPVGVVDRDGQTLITEDSNLFYAGCYGRATLVANFYEMAKFKKKGVTFYLENLQKTRDGAPYSGRKKASEEFESVEDDPEFNPPGDEGDLPGGGDASPDDGLGDLS